MVKLIGSVEYHLFDRAKFCLTQRTKRPTKHLLSLSTSRKPENHQKTVFFFHSAFLPRTSGPFQATDTGKTGARSSLSYIRKNLDYHLSDRATQCRQCVSKNQTNSWETSCKSIKTIIWQYQTED
jgi:hypothetical protein